MKFLFGFNAVPILFVLVASPAWAGCAVEQTSSNEIIIRTSVGGCNATQLRDGLAAAVASSDTVQASATRPSAFSEIRRSSSQGALWRLANMNNQAGLTSFTMPGPR